MALRVNFEFVIHVKNIRNIDLLHQGVYIIKISLYHHNIRINSLGVPYINEISHKKTLLSKPAFEENSYYSSAIPICFCEENVELNEFAEFLFEINIDNTSKIKTEIMLEYSLLFSSFHRFEKIASEHLNYSKFDILSTSAYQLNNISKNDCFYLPLILNELNYAISDTLIHFCMTKIDLVNSKGFNILVPDININALNSDKGKGDIQNIFIPFDSILSSAVPALISCYDKLRNNCLEIQELYPKLLYPKKLCIKYEIPLLYQANDKNQNSGRLISFELRNSKSFIGKVNERSPSLHDIPGNKEFNCFYQQNLEEIILNLDSKLILGWNFYKEIIRIYDKLVFNIKKEIFFTKNNLLINYFSFSRSSNDYTELMHFNDTQRFSRIKKLQKEVHKFENFSSISHKNTIDLNIFHNINDVPILYEEIIENEKINLKSDYKNKILLVFVHGYQGSSQDLRLLKNNLSLIFPEALFYMAEIPDTNDSISIMGEYLAHSLRNFIKSNNEEQITSISFISHSLGGLISRAAIPLLAEYKNKMKTFVSLASPHLGYIYSTHKFTLTGLWLLNELNHSIALNQLLMKDNSDPRQAFIYKLSEDQGFEWFSNFIFVVSAEDSYCPYESGRIEMHRSTNNDLRIGVPYVEMVSRILSKLKNKRIIKLDTYFKFGKINIDTLIGRAAHISFLDSEQFSRMFSYRYARYF